MVTEFIKRIDFIKENCFKKIYIHGDFQDFRLDHQLSQHMK
jgi:hypothetical protein